MSAHRNELMCKVTSAKPLDKATMNSLTKSLKGFAKNRDVKIDSAVDPTLIAGITVEIGDKFIDMSTKAQIKKITDSLKLAV